MGTRRRQWARGFLAMSEAGQRPQKVGAAAAPKPNSVCGAAERWTSSAQLRAFFDTYRGLGKWVGGLLLRFYAETEPCDEHAPLQRMIELTSNRFSSYTLDAHSFDI